MLVPQLSPSRVAGPSFSLSRSRPPPRHLPRVALQELPHLRLGRRIVIPRTAWRPTPSDQWREGGSKVDSIVDAEIGCSGTKKRRGRCDHHRGRGQ